MTDLSKFENKTGDNSGNSAESEKSDITVLEGRGNRVEIKLKDRARDAERLTQ